jgi:hypothetical protein
METQTHGKHGSQHHEHHHAASGHHVPSAYRLALSATLHCLLGCGIGEVVGMVVSMVIGLAVVPSFILSILLGFVFGFTLGIRPWLKSGYTFGQALKAVLIAEGLSIAIMEAAEVLTQVYVPGVLNAHLNQPIFWMGMGLALVAGFIAAYPVNLWMAWRGVVHRH